jgi:hypothetical protein
MTAPDTEPEGFTLIRTKLQRPRMPGVLILRRRLLDRLHLGSSRRRTLAVLTLLSMLVLARPLIAVHADTLQETKQIAEEAYIYAFPMLMGYRFAFATFLTPGLPSYRGSVNAIHGKAATLDHTFKDVITPNADTPYSLGMLDLRAEPLVLQVPAVTDGYYVLQFVYLFGTNPHFIGSRATGSKAGTYLAVGPGWEGEAGDAHAFDGVLPFDSDLVFVIGRTQLLGADDVPRRRLVGAGCPAGRPLQMSALWRRTMARPMCSLQRTCRCVPSGP